ncbi:hypothetical protein AVEN_177187-1 [Araneus ventricosus]|uniref:Uncharacterized protein n=1 Tax=Araneus ventricosus TaxID=182803 RepID=A0A4Y2V613_ARAVE|nr:hypothetical protein AVEN_177187-1 [Araneus ventricosus]
MSATGLTWVMQMAFILPQNLEAFYCPATATVYPVLNLWEERFENIDDPALLLEAAQTYQVFPTSGEEFENITTGRVSAIQNPATVCPIPLVPWV